jgi:cell division inhibitor SulA
MSQAYIELQQMAISIDGLNLSTSNTTEQKMIKSCQYDKQQMFSHLVTTEDTLSANFELIKILRSFEQSVRWTLLIAPQNIPDKALLNCCSVDMGKVLVVHEKRISSVMATIENALSQATCSAVVAWCEDISASKMIHINELAQKSQCHFYAFNKQNTNTNKNHAAH